MNDLLNCDVTNSEQELRQGNRGLLIIAHAFGGRRRKLCRFINIHVVRGSFARKRNYRAGPLKDSLCLLTQYFGTQHVWMLGEHIYCTNCLLSYAKPVFAVGRYQYDRGEHSEYGTVVWHLRDTRRGCLVLGLLRDRNHAP